MMKPMLAAAALLIAPFPAVAQPAQTTQTAQSGADNVDATIVVEGERLTRKEVRERANGFIRTLGVIQGERSVARWTSGICPHVFGVAPDIARMVESKIRAVGKEAGAPIAKADCKTNLLIAFVGNGRDLVKLIETEMPNAMGQVHGPDRQDLVKGDAPIRWWYTIGMGASTGGKALDTPPPASFGNSEGGGSALIDGVPTTNNYSSSLVRPPAIRTIDAATVVIDVNRAEGISLTAASAYAAFVGMAEIKNSAQPPVASILNIFGETDMSARPRDLTFWDGQFLDELYNMPLARFGRQQRGYLVKSIARGEGDGGSDGDGSK